MRPLNGALGRGVRETLAVAVTARRASASTAEPQGSVASEEFHEDSCQAATVRRDDPQLATVASKPWHADDASAAPLQTKGGARAVRAAAGMGRDCGTNEEKGGGGLRRGPPMETGGIVVQTRRLPQGQESSAGHHRVKDKTATSGSGTEQRASTNRPQDAACVQGTGSTGRGCPDLKKQNDGEQGILTPRALNFVAKPSPLSSPTTPPTTSAAELVREQTAESRYESRPLRALLHPRYVRPSKPRIE